MKPSVATVWLGGCSGCHMSFLDMDERLIELADKMELVYSPIADIKEFPRDVDVTLVEGAVANVEHEEFAHTIRRNSRYRGLVRRLRRHGQRHRHAERVDTEERSAPVLRGAGGHHSADPARVSRRSRS